MGNPETSPFEVVDSATQTKPRIRLDADKADISAGGEQVSGDLILKDGDGNERIRLGTGTYPGLGSSGRGKVKTQNTAWGLWIKDADGKRFIILGPGGDLTLGGPGIDGDLKVNDKDGNVRIEAGGDEARMRLKDSSGKVRVILNGKNGAPVAGYADSGGDAGVYGTNSNLDGFGVYGENTSMSVQGGRSYGVLGLSLMTGVETAEEVGVFGDGSIFGSGVVGVGAGVGVKGAGGKIGVYGVATGGIGNWAGYFDGPVHTGDLHVAGYKNFIIDHPLSPSTMYLMHCSVESNESLNVYTGTVVLDSKGGAWVKLPNWFEALNGKYRYQLTAIGGPAPDLHVAVEISDNRFKIAGGRPKMKVSWQVGGVRKDAYAKAHPVQTEVKKTKRDTYLHPVEHGMPQKKAISVTMKPPSITRPKGQA